MISLADHIHTCICFMFSSLVDRWSKNEVIGLKLKTMIYFLPRTPSVQIPTILYLRQNFGEVAFSALIHISKFRLQ